MSILRGRPSKTFFFRRFAEDMRRHAHGRWGADIASSDWKNRAYFRTERYVGVDLDFERLRKGRQRQEGNGYGVMADLLHPGLLPGGFDFLACTHTLSHIPPPLRVRAVANLIALLKPGGRLVLNAPCGRADEAEAIVRALRAAFASVRVFRYRNALSRWFERRAQDADGRLVLETDRPRLLRRAAIRGLAALEGLPLLNRTGDMLYACALGAGKSVE